MPQMAPINWLILFIIFFLTMMIFNIKNYYCLLYKFKNNSHSLNMKSNQMNWKW